MTFSERELWIYYMTVMHTSEIAKSVPKETRQAIEMYAWKKLSPSVNG